MKSEIINLIGNKKMTSDEIALYFDDVSEEKIKELLDELVKNKVLLFEDGKYFKNNGLISKEGLIYYLKNASFDNAFHIAKHFHLKKEAVEEMLRELEKEGILYTKKNESKNYYYIYTGEISIKTNNDWIIDDENHTRYEILNSKGYFSGDRCKYVRYYYEAKIIDVIERKFKSLVGVIKVKTKLNKKTNNLENIIKFWPSVKGFNMVLTLSEDILNGAKDKDVVLLDIDYDNNGVKPVRVKKVITRYNDNYVEIMSKIYEFGFEIDFPKEVSEEAKNIPSYVSEEELAGRSDYRDMNIITIDNDDSKDFDDAVSVEKLKNGNYKLGVYIADVTNYVKEDSPLDKEALSRGTSLYLADMVVPMLPFELSNGICSLNPNVDRLVLACIMEINNKGEVVNYSIEEGVIKSKYQMTYSKVNKIFAGDKESIDEYKDIYEMLIDMKELSHLIRERREAKGALDFDAFEYKFKMENGVPTEVNKVTRGIAERLIEDFMLIANETIAYNAKIMELPIVYRVHEDPDQDKLKEVIKAIYSMGYKIKKMKNGIHAKELQGLLNSLKEDSNYEIISDMILRSMMKAKYSEQNLGHYGLQLENYCHFTSPIRRYPDLMTHRVIKNVMLHPKTGKEYGHFYKVVPVVALRNSLSEKKSIDLERKVDDILYAKLYESKIGLSFVGKIMSITNFGMFIKLDDGLEGLLPYSNMPSYVYVNENNTEAEDENGIYKIGDEIRITVSSVDKNEGLVEFGPCRRH